MTKQTDTKSEVFEHLRRLNLQLASPVIVLWAEQNGYRDMNRLDAPFFSNLLKFLRKCK